MWGVGSIRHRLVLPSLAGQTMSTEYMVICWNVITVIILILFSVLFIKYLSILVGKKLLYTYVRKRACATTPENGHPLATQVQTLRNYFTSRDFNLINLCPPC